MRQRWRGENYKFTELGIGAAAARRRIEELLALVNLTDARKRPLGGFSGGIKQRVGIAQALLNVWRPGSKLFECFYTALWYIGPLQPARKVDFIGASPAAVASGIRFFIWRLQQRCWLWLSPASVLISFILTASITGSWWFITARTAWYCRSRGRKSN